MESDFTLRVNLKCEEIYDTGNPIMEQSEAKLDIQKLAKRCRVKLSIHTCNFYQDNYTHN